MSKYRAAFEQSRDAIMFLDKRHILEVNQAMLAMFRADSEDAFRASDPGDISPPVQPDGQPSAEAARDRIKEAVKRGQALFDWQHRRLDGQDFPAEVMLSRIDTPEGTVLEVLIRDVSDRWAAEASRDRVLAILDATPDMVLISGRDGQLMYMNPTGLRLLGEDTDRTGLSTSLPEWIRREAIWELVHPEWAWRRIHEEALPAAERAGVWQGETALLDREGREIPVSQIVIAHYDQDEVTHFSSILHDISEAKRIEGQLRERIKELGTLRDVIVLTTDDERSLQALLDDCANRLPAGWTSPQRTAVRIRAGGLKAVSEPFFETEHRQHAEIDDPEIPVDLEVFFDSGQAPVPSLPEEGELLESIARQLHNALARRVTQQKLERLATHDHLTGLHNRISLSKWLEQSRAENARYTTPFSLIMLDIDHFKAVNDRFGHQAGDEVLRELVRRVNQCLRESDVHGRWGGEEFLVLAPHTNTQGAAEMAERLREAVAQSPFDSVGPVTISLGVANYEAGETVERLEGRVDKALYRAKEAGRNRVVVAEPTAR
ncbi:MAG: diguanylate cyclase [Guyparkeria sp.]